MNMEPDRFVEPATPTLAGLDAEARAEQRLREQSIIWLTTVTTDGQPQTSPVGYTWDGTAFLILTKHGAPKVRNLRANPRVSLHLDLDIDAPRYSVLTIEGVAQLDPAAPGRPARLTERETSTYVEKHGASMRWAGVTPEETFAQFSTVIRVRPTRARAY